MTKLLLLMLIVVIAKAAEMGYKYFEPMVHFGRELMSEARC
jgi:hypothetical protein